MNNFVKNFNFFLFQRHLFNLCFFSGLLKTKNMQYFFFQNFNCSLLKQMSLSSANFFKGKINLVAQNVFKLKNYCNAINLMQTVPFASNSFVGSNVKFKHLFSVGSSSEKKINYFLSMQKQKYSVFFFF